LAVVVVDAGQLTRNLYLVIQLIELRVPLVVALNMIDEVPSPPDAERLSTLLGVPVVPTSARRGEGMDALRRAVSEGLASPPVGHVAIAYPERLLARLPDIVDALPAAWQGSDEQDGDAGEGLGRTRALALWALASIDEYDELAHIPHALRERCLAVHRETQDDIDLDIVAPRYAYLDEHVGEADVAGGDDAQSAPPKRKLSERIDAIVLHRRLGFVIFALVMLVVFQSLFTWSDPAIGLVEDGVSWLQDVLVSSLPAGVVTSLLSEGVIGGVGNVVVFLPQILLLFFLLGLLEDSGYMARAAYLMDRIMRSLGLHGRAFVPMLSGCACAIPAIMATRTMERQRDRLLTMLVIPLMTCSARLPVYTLIIGALFPPSKVVGLPVQGLLMVFMYLFSTMVALIAAGVLGRTVVKGRRMPLLLELPPYRLPTLATVVRQMFERAGVFLKEAGTVILACTIVLWALLSYPEPNRPEPLGTVAVASWHQAASAASEGGGTALDPATLADNGDAQSAWQSEKLRGSVGGQLGRTIEPFIAPLGFDWRLGIGIIGAFAAREVFVSTMGLVYGIGDADDASEPLRDKIRSERRADGKPVYTPLTGLSLMIFFALACQCMSTLAVVKRETRSWKWPLFLFAYMTTLAYVCSLIVYQGGRFLGFA
jgi:ferrous iron transport protein B